jgi:hypothetical protein
VQYPYDEYKKPEDFSLIKSVKPNGGHSKEFLLSLFVRFLFLEALRTNSTPKHGCDHNPFHFSREVL